MAQQVIDTDYDPLLQQTSLEYPYWNVRAELKTTLTKPSYHITNLPRYLDRWMLSNTSGAEYDNLVYQHIETKQRVENLTAELCVPIVRKIAKHSSGDHQGGMKSGQANRFIDFSSSTSQNRDFSKSPSDIFLSFPPMESEPKLYTGLLSTPQPTSRTSSHQNDTTLRRFGVYGQGQLFSCGDVYESMLRIKNPNIGKQDVHSVLSVLPTIPTLEELRVIFSDLSPGKRHKGLDEQYDPQFASEIHSLSKKLSKLKYIPLVRLRQLCRRGCDESCRKIVWSIIQDPDGLCRRSHSMLDQSLSEWSLMADDIIAKDCLIRDEWVKETIQEIGMVESLPFIGISMFAAPLEFVSTDPAQKYSIFRGLYTRYFRKLSHLASEPESLIHLCALFESLAQSFDISAYIHCLKLGVPPLKIAFRWIYYAFSGFLHPSQLLLLWDRMIGFDSLWILPILAAAIFAFRGASILICSNVEQLYGLFSSMTSIEVVPLLQFFLFA
ncbi:putative TBC1 domain family member 19 [Blattamonas nauphoetae]|uniref:TBC1 domain family member 19 n=1 Tax=Blattamonas nauphoetae TaxID=2049346 RepID=A0ABQ9YAM9_9EUKA|nr:putative TBC1 domain family member 19 [Blattamonas nauphoetae]